MFAGLSQMHREDLGCINDCMYIVQVVMLDINIYWDSNCRLVFFTSRKLFVCEIKHKSVLQLENIWAKLLIKWFNDYIYVVDILIIFCYWGL